MSIFILPIPLLSNSSPICGAAPYSSPVISRMPKLAVWVSDTVPEDSKLMVSR